MIKNALTTLLLTLVSMTGQAQGPTAGRTEPGYDHPLEVGRNRR